jgi:thioredoxin 1
VETVDVTDGNFRSSVLESKTPVLVDFWAPWCAPCRMLAPILGQIAAQYGQKLKVAKLNIDSSPNVPTKFGVRSIPTMILFRDGKALGILQGALPKASIVAFLGQHIPDLEAPVITVRDLAARLDERAVTHIVDIRPKNVVARGHIRRAQACEPEALSSWVQEIPPDDAVVLVCRTGADSKAAVASLSRPNTYALLGGLLEWEGIGKPTYSDQEEIELGDKG